MLAKIESEIVYHVILLAFTEMHTCDPFIDIKFIYFSTSTIPENIAITRIESPSKQPQSWVKFTAPSPVLEKSSLRHQRYVSPHPILYVRCCLPMRRSMITAPQNLRRMATNIRCLQVEPQEKKKTPKGRAKKRITYTRRFVNVTMTGGKRKVRYGFEI